jgi:hypothetical protein
LNRRRVVGVLDNKGTFTCQGVPHVWIENAIGHDVCGGRSVRRLQRSTGGSKDMNLAIGIAMLLLAALLIYLGRPDREGNSPRFLRFGAALVLYPPAVLVVLAFGAAELFYSLS